MNRHSFLLCALLAPTAFAHVSLDEPRGEVGAAYQAVFRVGHGCESAATTALTVRLPAGFAAAKPAPKPGWTVTTQSDAVTWTAGPGAALANKDKGDFVLAGTLPRQAGPLWFKVLQSCGAVTQDWAQLPATGTSTEGLKTPAVLLDVVSARDLAAWRALPKVEGGWVRAAVPGQQATGAFMRITAKEATQLVGVSSPIAGVADVHEMKLEGDVMRMRPVARLDLPAGRTIELQPGGYHVMLQELKQPVAVGGHVPVTLLLRNAAGAESKLELKLPVRAASPGGHKH